MKFKVGDIVKHKAAANYDPQKYLITMRGVMEGQNGIKENIYFCSYQNSTGCSRMYFEESEMELVEQKTN